MQSLYLQVCTAGYKSVAHMMILQNQAPAEAMPVIEELEEMPEAGIVGFPEGN